MSDVGRGLLKNISSVLITKVIVLLLGLVGTILIARGLGVEGRGIYAALLVYPSLLIALTEGGMRQAAMHYIGKNKAPDAEIIGTLFTYTLIAGIGGYFAVYWLQFQFGQDQFTQVMMLVAAAMLPATLAVNAIKGVFLGKERIKQFNKASWVQKILFVFIISVFYFSGNLNVTTAIFATLGAAVFNLFQALLFLRNSNTLSFKFSVQTFFPMFKIGLVYALAFFFITANYRIDILLLSWLSNPVEIGQYALAVQLGELMWQLPGAVLIVLMSKTANSHDKSIINDVVKTTRITFFLMLLSALPFIGFCYFLITPVFGIEFAGSFEIILFLLPGLIVASVFKTINAYFAGQGKPHVTIYLMGGVAGLNVSLNYALIPIYGAIGAGVATTISYIVSALGCCLLMSRYEDVGIKSLIIPSISDIQFFRNN